MCDSEVEESPMRLSPRGKSLKLYQEVFGHPRITLQRKHKRKRPMYVLYIGPKCLYSPPSTPNGNHLIAAVELDVEEEDESAAFTPRCVLRQCIAEQKTLVQEACVNPTDADWILMASYLSPAKPPGTLLSSCNTIPRVDAKYAGVLRSNIVASYLSPAKPPLHPNTKTNIHPRASCQSKSDGVPCLCISCAGLKAKPICTPCLVCGALIPYSVCIKSLGE
jgi:hypothetical protein